METFLSKSPKHDEIADTLANLNNNDSTQGNIEMESDFIVLGEFSEKDGPVPREVIGPCSPKFPLDNFVLRLMSVELQLEFGEKWSVWIDWTSQRVESLVVHFQLQDVNARGYCRPLALAYVTYDPKKLIKYRDDYLTVLNKITDMMLEANSKLFKLDVKQRLLDLSLVGKIQELLSTEEENLNESQKVLTNKIRNELKSHRIFVPKRDTFEEILQDMNNMYLKMKSPDNFEEHLQQKFNEGEEYLLSHVDNLNSIPELSRVRELQFKNSLYDKNLKSLEELTSPVYPDAMKLLFNALETLRHDQIVLEHISSERRQCFAPSSALLSIGNVAMLNFNLDPQTTFHNITNKSTVNFQDIWNRDIDDKSKLYVGGPEFEDLEVESISTILWPSYTASLANVLSREDSSSSVNSYKILSETEDSDNHEMTSDLLLHTEMANDVKDKQKHKVKNIPKIRGYSLLELRNVSFNRHLIYTLLKGRPLVIHAESKHKQAVVNTIESLKIFVCGYHLIGDKKVVPWRDETSLLPGQKHVIDLQSLSTYKLVGIDKSCTIPRNVELHISIWDWENESLACPPYEKGKLIDLIVNPKKQWPNEITYRGHIHYVLLSEFSMKACILYHMCCIGVPDTVPDIYEDMKSTPKPSSLKLGRKNQDTKKEEDSGINNTVSFKPGLQEVYSDREKVKMVFFKQLDLTENDAVIIEYLTEVVKENQSKRHPKSDNKPKRICLDYAPIKTFKNVPIR